jgi:hypothetical protein
MALLSWTIPGIAGEFPITAVGEYQVKAALIYNFTRFVEWPQNPGALRFCVAGQRALFSALEDISGKRPIEGQRADVRWFNPAAPPPAECNVLILAIQDPKLIRAIVSAVEDRDVLTVGQWAQFLETGGIVNFVAVRGQIHFEFNLCAAQRAHLTISSRLLTLAERVYRKCNLER